MNHTANAMGANYVDHRALLIEEVRILRAACDHMQTTCTAGRMSSALGRVPQPKTVLGGPETSGSPVLQHFGVSG